MITPNEMSMLFIFAGVTTLCAFFAAFHIAAISKDIKKIADSKEAEERTSQAVTRKGPQDIMY